MSKELVKMTDEQLKAVEKELSDGHNVEMWTRNGDIIIKRIDRKTVQVNSKPDDN